jgi:RHS repeat-associated protein
LNTPRDLVDATGTLAHHRVFNAFGVETNPQATDFLFGFTGRPTDNATGLQNNLHRWYGPDVGRWLSEDPIGLDPDTNPYRYVGNGPTNATDPNGLDASITRGDIHTGIEVHLRDNKGKVIGIMSADFQAQGFRSDSQIADCWGFSVLWGAPGRIQVVVRLNQPRLSGARIIQGSSQQDDRLVDWILTQVGKDRKWLGQELALGNRSWRLQGVGQYAKYYLRAQNCNGFTADAISVYIGGREWLMGVEAILDDDHLMRLWDKPGLREAVIKAQEQMERIRARDGAVFRRCYGNPGANRD